MRGACDERVFDGNVLRSRALTFLTCNYSVAATVWSWLECLPNPMALLKIPLQLTLCTQPHLIQVVGPWVITRHLSLLPTRRVCCESPRETAVADGNLKREVSFSFTSRAESTPTSHANSRGRSEG